MAGLDWFKYSFNHRSVSLRPRKVWHSAKALHSFTESTWKQSLSASSTAVAKLLETLEGVAREGDVKSLYWNIIFDSISSASRKNIALSNPNALQLQIFDWVSFNIRNFSDNSLLEVQKKYRSQQNVSSEDLKEAAKTYAHHFELQKLEFAKYWGFNI